MNPTRHHQWFQSKLELARFLVAERGDQAEPDAQILLCCAISGLAAILWPGTGIDRQRFIQLLIDYSPSTANLHLISTPVLASQLRDRGDTSSAIALSSKFFPVHPSQFLNPNEVDHKETAVCALLKSLELKNVRRASYAAIIYADLRCALVHEYSVSPHITAFNLFGIHNIPSYVNMTYDNGQTRYLLHFPLHYLVDILSSTADALFAHWSTSSVWANPRPSSWWADG
jgi:hypothetical protein